MSGAMGLPEGFTLDEAPAGALPAGFTVDVQHPVSGPSGSLWTDIKHRAGTTLAETAAGILGAPRAVGQGVDWLAGKAGFQPGVSDFMGKIKGLDGKEQYPEPAAARERIYGSTGLTEYVPETYGGRLGQAALNAAPMALLSGGAGALRAVPGAMAGGATSEAAGEWAAEHGWSPAAQFFARLAGGVPGQAVGNVAAKTPVKPLWQRIQGPEKSQLAQMATETYGIPLGVGNTTDNRFVRGLYSESGKMPMSGAAGFREKQLDSWTRGVTQSFGEDSPRITPDVINSARTRLGNEFDTIAGRTNITADPQIATDLRAVIRSMPYAGLAEGERSAIRALTQNLVDQFDPRTGQISGDAYQRLTRQGAPFHTALNSAAPNVREFAGQIKTALDDALQRSARPEDVAALQNARAQWKALMTVEPLTIRADAHGVATPSTGIISPAALRSAVNSSYKRVAQAAPGEIPLHDLARIGQHFLKDSIPDSGTPMREAARHTIAGPATAAMTAMMAGDHMLGMPMAASAALGAGVLASGAATNWMLRNPDALRRMLPNPAISALTAAQPNQAAPFSFAPQEPSQ